MDDSGYANYQDPRLQPPDDEGDPTPAECLERCLHKDACIMQCMWIRYLDKDEDFVCLADRLANDLGCSIDCECYTEV